MPAAVAVPLILGAASAGTSLVAAKMGSSAAKNAAKTQAASADQAQRYNQQVYDYQKQITQPYITQGQTSLANLMAQHWGGRPEQYGLPQGAPMAAPQGVQSLATFGQPQGQQGPQVGGQGYARAVSMRAPDGSVRQVPPQLVSKYQQMGAVPVGG
jgi:hypothetical protein